jgi:hypothetical protein
VELDAISQPELEQIERVGSADLVIGIFDLEHQEDGSAAVAMTRAALAELSMPLRAVVACNNGSHSPAATTPEVEGDERSPIVSFCSLPVPGTGETPLQSISNAYRRVFAVGSKLGVRACGVLVSSDHQATREWIYRLIQPVVDLGFDFVAPCYSRQKMEGLLNRNLLSPLHRALYGEQLENPMGPDFGLSGKLLQRFLGQDSARRGASEHNLLA